MCVCVCVCVCMHIHYICLCIRAYYISVCLSICIYVCIYVCIYWHTLHARVTTMDNFQSVMFLIAPWPLHVTSLCTYGLVTCNDHVAVTALPLRFYYQHRFITCNRKERSDSPDYTLLWVTIRDKKLMCFFTARDLNEDVLVYKNRVKVLVMSLLKCRKPKLLRLPIVFQKPKDKKPQKC